GKFPGEPAPSLQRTAAAPLDPGDVPPLLRSGAGRADGGGGRGEGGGLRVRAGLVAAAVAGGGLPALRPAVAGRVAPRAAPPGLDPLAPPLPRQAPVRPVGGGRRARGRRPDPLG